MNSKLTIKQENFCMKYVELGNASEAYRSACNADSTSDSVIHVKASELLKNGKVTVRLAELKAEHKERHNISVGLIVDRLEEARELALSKNQASAAVGAAMGQAKVAGLLVDKQQHSNDPDNPMPARILVEIMK